MSAVLQELTPDVVVPDGIEPVEEWRAWSFDGKTLRAVVQNIEWPAGKQLEAKCINGGDMYSWDVVPRGLTCEEARKVAKRHNHWNAGAFRYGPTAPTAYVSSPTVEPPPGYGYRLVKETHEAPHVNCGCGIYGVHDIKDAPGADVWGKVKMWGTVIPGTQGSRAQYAYPCELHVPKKWADHPALLAYGVPLIPEDKSSTESPFALPEDPLLGRRRVLNAVIAGNIAACALNVGIAVSHLV